MGLVLAMALATALVLWKPGGEGGSALAGVFIGSMLTYLFGEYSQNRREAARNHGARTALRRELDQNISNLAHYWDESKTAPDVRSEQLTSRESRFVLGLFPPWSLTMWISQAPLIASALSEKELAAAMQLQRDYENLHMFLHRIEPWLRGDSNPSRLTSELWYKIDITMNKILSDGNPISDDDETSL